MKDLEEQFTAAMHSTHEAAARRGRAEIQFLEEIEFLWTLERRDGVETARCRLVERDARAGGAEIQFLAKIEFLSAGQGLLDQSMEAHVLDEKYRALFTEDEHGEARRRLKELGYFTE